MILKSLDSPKRLCRPYKRELDFRSLTHLRDSQIGDIVSEED
jgi:hypothetical protein